MKLILALAAVALLIGSAHAQPNSRSQIPIPIESNPHPQIPDWARAVGYCRVHVIQTVEPTFDAFVSREDVPGQLARVDMFGTPRACFMFQKCMTQVGQDFDRVPVERSR